MPRKTKKGRGTKRRGRAAGRARAKGDDGRSGPNSFVEWAKSIGIAVVLFLILRTFIVQTFVITSGSMKDTLLIGDFLVVNRMALGSRVPFSNVRIPGYSRPRRFDVIVFDPPHEPDLKLVKRLIGLPGDTVEMRDRQLLLNGEAVDEPYVRHENVPDQVDPIMAWQLPYLGPGVEREEYRPTRDSWGPLVIPEDHYFMLGDNRETSYDSRYWGFLERWRLEGRASVIYFSYDRESLKPFGPVTAARLGRIGTVIR